jgi:HEAT repeat protein
VVDEPDFVINELEEIQQPADAVANSSEAHATEFDMQSELSKLEADASSLVAHSGDQSAAEEIEFSSEDFAASPLAGSLEASLPPATMADSEKSMDLTGTEKGIQTSGKAQLLSAFAEGLTSDDTAKRAATLQELGELDDDEAFSLITDLFDDASEDVRSAAARALYEFKPDRAASFTRALREGSAQRRRNIASALNSSGLAATAIDSLAGESREKTYDAFSLLFLMAKAGEVQTLLQTIEKHPDIAVRLSVIRLLTFSNQPDIVPAFRSLAVRGSLPTEVRSAVMEAIYQISSNARDSSLSAA